MFESMNHVCHEKVWDRVLSFNFSIFLNRIKRNLEDDLYLKFRFSSFVFSSLSLYSVFSHFCFCKRKCDHKKSTQHYCELCSWIYLQLFDSYVAFQDIIIDEQNFTLEFNELFEKTSLFSLDVWLNHAFFIDAKKAKIFKCAYFNLIETPKKSFKAFLTILIRLYLSFFFLY